MAKYTFTAQPTSDPMFWECWCNEHPSIALRWRIHSFNDE